VLVVESILGEGFQGANCDHGVRDRPALAGLSSFQPGICHAPPGACCSRVSFLPVVRAPGSRGRCRRVALALGQSAVATGARPAVWHLRPRTASRRGDSLRRPRSRSGPGPRVRSLADAPLVSPPDGWRRAHAALLAGSHLRLGARPFARVRRRCGLGAHAHGNANVDAARHQRDSPQRAHRPDRDLRPGARPRRAVRWRGLAHFEPVSLGRLEPVAFEPDLDRAHSCRRAPGRA